MLLEGEGVELAIFFFNVEVGCIWFMEDSGLDWLTVKEFPVRCEIRAKVEGKH